MQKYIFLFLLGAGANSLAAQQLPAAPPPAGPPGPRLLPTPPLPTSPPRGPAPDRALFRPHALRVGKYAPRETGLTFVPPAACALGVLPGSRAAGAGSAPVAAAAASLANFFLSDFNWQRYQQQRAFSGRDTDPAGYLTGRPQ